MKRGERAHVVVVKPPDDHPGQVRVFGVMGRERAIEMETRVREACEADPLDETSGFAYAMPLERWNISQAIEWATRGERIEAQ